MMHQSKRRHSIHCIFAALALSPAMIAANELEVSGYVDAEWRYFGETALDLGLSELVAEAIQPDIGKCVFFPSYFWHGTYPHESDDYRVTIPCDIDPVRLLSSS